MSLFFLIFVLYSPYLMLEQRYVTFFDQVVFELKRGNLEEHPLWLTEKVMVSTF